MERALCDSLVKEFQGWKANLKDKPCGKESDCTRLLGTRQGLDDGTLLPGSPVPSKIPQGLVSLFKNRARRKNGPRPSPVVSDPDLKPNPSHVGC